MSKFLLPFLSFQAVEKTPEGSVTKEEYLLAAVENRPKTLQKFIDQGGAVNTVDEVSGCPKSDARIFLVQTIGTSSSSALWKYGLRDRPFQE